MIPSIPEVICATHVEYLPLSAVYLKSLVEKSRNQRKQNHNVRLGSSNIHRQCISKEKIIKINDVRTIHQFVPINVSTVPQSIRINYYRGKDLCYASHMKIPAAESIHNS